MNGYQETDSSITLYGDVNYTPGINGEMNASHGETSLLANSPDDWVYKSIKTNGLQAFILSGFFPLDTKVSYLNHVDDFLTADTPDLPSLYGSIQPPLYYLAIDPSIAATVRLVLNAQQALSSTSEIPDTNTTLNALCRPGHLSTIAFISRTEGAAVNISCNYGVYHDDTGFVEWNGSGIVNIEYTEDKVIITNLEGFPASWLFSTPVLQDDGTYVLKIDVEHMDYLSSLQTQKNSILNDGYDNTDIVASVRDTNTSEPVPNQKVTWSTDKGNLSASYAYTDSNGQAYVRFRDSGDIGYATITATLENGDKRSVDVYLTDTQPLKWDGIAKADNPIRNITFDMETGNISAAGLVPYGFTFSLSASGGSGNITYSTSDPAVVNLISTSSGNFTLEGPGTAEIKAIDETGRTITYPIVIGRMIKPLQKVGTWQQGRSAPGGGIPLQSFKTLYQQWGGFGQNNTPVIWRSPAGNPQGTWAYWAKEGDPNSGKGWDYLLYHGTGHEEPKSQHLALAEILTAVS